VLDSEAVDVYGLGALIYATLAGVGPFEGVRGPARAIAQINGEVTPPSLLRPALPPRVDRVLLRALSPDPARRQSSVVGLVDDLENAMEGFGPPSASASGFEPRSRGLMFRDYRRAVRAKIGEQEETTLFARLPAEVREAFATATDLEEFYPATPLVAYLRAYSGGDPARLEDLGEALGGVNIPTALTAMRVARTPEALIHVVQPLASRFHDWAKTRVQMSGTHEARVALALPLSCVGRGAPRCEMRLEWLDL
jgi:hypothetical protein